MKIPFSYSIKSLFQRKVSTLMTVGSFALVVVVLMVSLAMLHGIQETLISAGSPDRVFVLSKNATTENKSQLPTMAKQAVVLHPEIKLDSDGRPVTSEEVVKTTYIEGLHGGRVQVNFRGVDFKKAQEVHYQFELVNGRLPDPILGNEVLVGKSIFESTQAAIGDHFIANQQEWKILGVFEDDGSPFESEIWTSRSNMIFGFDAQEISSIWMVLKDPNFVSTLIERLNNDRQTFVHAVAETEYFAEGMNSVDGYVALAWFIAVVLSIGAIFSAMNTMYASLADRTGELGALRAIGFQAGSVRWATLLETLIMAFLGFVVATVIIFFLQGFPFIAPIVGLGYISFKLSLTPMLVIIGFLFSIIMGGIGGWIPVNNATRIPIIEALNK